MINYPFDAVKYMCERPEHGPTGMFPINVSDASSNATAAILLQQQHQQQQQSLQPHQHEQPPQSICNLKVKKFELSLKMFNLI